MSLQVCLNGSRHADEHPGVPTTPQECARQAREAVAAGADDVHVHPRTADGRDSLVADDVAAWVEAVRAVVDVPVGVTTGAWAWTGGLARADAVRAWHVRPDHASVNWHERDAAAVASALLAGGVDVNAGLWTAEAARDWLASPLREGTGRILLELADAPDQESEARALLDLVSVFDGPILVHGEERSAWPMLALARALGLGARIGLEDVLVGPDGESVDGNTELVRCAAAVVSST